MPQPCPESFQDLLSVLAETAPAWRLRAIVVLSGPLDTSMYHADAGAREQAAARSWLEHAGLKGVLGEPGDVLVRHLISLPDVDLLERLRLGDNELPGGAAVVEATPSALFRLMQVDEVVRVEEDSNYRVALDSLGPVVGAAKAHASGHTGAGVTVAIIDTGIDPNHPAFMGRISGASTNFTNEGGSRDVTDRNGHGTHVAGIVGGDGEPGGTYVGVAPSANLVVLKALKANGTGSAGDVAAAISFAVGNGVDVINFSSGYSPWDPPSSLVRPPWLWSTTPTFEELMFMAAVAMGVVTVVSAGNSGALQPQHSTISRPGRLEPVITVGSVDMAGRALSSFSSRGPVRQTHTIGAGRVVTNGAMSPPPPVVTVDKPDVVAPGGERNGRAPAGQCPHQAGVMSALAAGLGPPWTTCAHASDPYAYSSGTSMATAAVSGIAALATQFADRNDIDLRSRDDRALIVKRILMESATDVGLPSHEQGSGLVTWSEAERRLSGIADGNDFLDNYAPVP